MVMIAIQFFLFFGQPVADSTPMEGDVYQKRRQLSGGSSMTIASK
jgi:hypothetical protein